MSFFSPVPLGVLGLLAALSAPQLVVSSAAAQGLSALESSPDHLLRYTECMKLARREPLRALPLAEKWNAEGGGLGAAFFGQGGVGAAADAVLGVPDGFAVADDI